MTLHSGTPDTAVQPADTTTLAQPPVVLAPAPGPARPARPGRGRRRRSALPYALLAPAVAVLGFMLGYPLYRLVVLALHDYGLAQVFGTPAEFIGLDNFRKILGDDEFWSILWRTLIFCAVNVALTIVIGTLVALLLQALGPKMRTLVATALILAWAMPPLSATIVWQWMFDTQYGLVNWALRTPRHGWFAEPVTFFMVATIIVVWMGVPFVAFTLYAALTQIPDSLIEAAHLDGATFLQRFRYVLFPMLKPILLIVTSLSVLWDFRVFTQIYVLQKAGGISRETNLLGVYAYRISIGSNEYGVGAAVALVMVAITVLLTIIYLRSMLRSES